MSYEEIINRNEKHRIILFDDDRQKQEREAQVIHGLIKSKQLTADKENEKGLKDEWQQEYEVIYQSYVLES